MAKINKISNNDKAMRPNGIIPKSQFLILFGKSGKSWVHKIYTKNILEKDNCIARLTRDKIKFKIITKNYL